MVLFFCFWREDTLLTADASIRHYEDVDVGRERREDEPGAGDDAPGNGHHATPVTVDQQARHRTCRENGFIWVVLAEG